jgi:hypothetical protein
MEGSRDNLRFRGSLGHLSAEGARMVWNDETIGVRPTNVRGRGTITGPDATPLPAQYWLTPDLDRHEMYRGRLSDSERALVDALTPAPYSPQRLTKDGLWLPPSAEEPKPGGVEGEMNGVKDIVKARDLRENDVVKLEDSSERMTQAHIEYVEYDEDSQMVTLDLLWEGGRAEQVEMEGAEDVWFLGNAQLV